MVAKMLALLAGVSLAVAPAAAQPAAQSLSVRNAVPDRAGPELRGESDLAGGGWLPIIVALAIVTGGVLLAAGVFDDDNDRPASP